MLNILKKHYDLTIILSILLVVFIFMVTISYTFAFFFSNKSITGTIILGELDYDVVIVNNQNDIITLKKLKTMKDDSYASIKGFIVKQISDEKFLFKDETGEIVLDMDDDLMYQLKDIDKNTLVEIYGELDKNTFSRDEFEVKKITIIK